MVAKGLGLACMMSCFKPLDSKEFAQMTSNKHRLTVYGAAILLFLVAVVCYAAFPVPEPEEPIRLMYQTIAGKVLFDHQTHVSEFGFGISCFDCHHHPPEDDLAKVACSECHLSAPEEGVFPESCLECHDEDEIEDSEFPKHADAIHLQCWTCHDQYGAGPGEGSDNCSKCHVL